MKKLSNLISSLSILCLAIAALCFGVFAAIKVTYQVSGSISYEVSGAFVDIDTKIYASSTYLTNEQVDTKVEGLISETADISALGLSAYKTDIPVFKSQGSDELETQPITGVNLTENNAYFFVINVKNNSSDINVWAQAKESVYPTNVYEYNSGMQTTIQGNSKNIVIALAVDDPTVSLSGDYTIGVDVGTEEAPITFDSNTQTVSKSTTQTVTELNIPNYVDGTKVEVLGDFSNLTTLTKLTVPKTVETASQGALNGCNALEDLTIPFVGNNRDITETESITANKYGTSFTDTVLAKTEYFGHIFDFEFSDTGVGPEGSNASISFNIGPATCYYYYTIPTSLKNVKVTDMDKIFGFRGIQIELLYDLGDPTEISFAAFQANNATLIEIPKTVQILCGNTFYGCSLKQVIFEEGSQLTSIEGYDFWYCTNLLEITIPSGVNSIGNFAFYYCSSLASVSIPSGVESIGDSAFSYCSSLTEIIIPNSVTSIGDSAFNGCQFTNVICNIQGTNYSLVNGKLTIKNMRLEEDTEYPEWYNDGINGLVTSVEFPANCTEIVDNAVYNCDSLTEITIPSSVTNIGTYAFSDCDNLTSVIFAENSQLESIGESAFNGCQFTNVICNIQGTDYSLVNGKLTIKNLRADTTVENTSCPEWHNDNINPLVTSVEFPANCTEIVHRAFYDCDSLTEITIPSSIKIIEYASFSSCSNLENIIFMHISGTVIIKYQAFDTTNSDAIATFVEGVSWSDGTNTYTASTTLTNLQSTSSSSTKTWTITTTA